MKRSIASFLVLCMVVLCTFSYAEDFDVSFFEMDKRSYDVSVSDDGFCVIAPKISDSEVAFRHKYESPYVNSTIKTAIVVRDYYSTNRFPLFTTAITLNEEKAVCVYAVAFELLGKKYVLSHVKYENTVPKTKYGYCESIMIQYGKNNQELFSVLASEAFNYYNNRYVNNDTSVTPPNMKMTLIGLEEIEVSVPEGFWINMAGFVIPFMYFDYMHFIGEAEGTPCKVTTVE